MQEQYTPKDLESRIKVGEVNEDHAKCSHCFETFSPNYQPARIKTKDPVQGEVERLYCKECAEQYKPHSIDTLIIQELKSITHSVAHGSSQVLQFTAAVGLILLPGTNLFWARETAKELLENKQQIAAQEVIRQGLFGGGIDLLYTGALTYLTYHQLTNPSDDTKPLIYGVMALLCMLKLMYTAGVDASIMDKYEKVIPKTIQPKESTPASNTQ